MLVGFVTPGAWWIVQLAPLPATGTPLEQARIHATPSKGHSHPSPTPASPTHPFRKSASSAHPMQANRLKTLHSRARLLPRGHSGSLRHLEIHIQVGLVPARSRTCGCSRLRWRLCTTCRTCRRRSPTRRGTSRSAPTSTSATCP